MKEDIRKKGRKLPPVSKEATRIIHTIRAYEAPQTSGWRAASEESPVIWHKGEGAIIEDIDGNRYVDLTAGNAVAIVGHCNPKVVAAIIEQSQKLIHTASPAGHPLRAQLLEMLVKRAPSSDLNRVIFRRGGAEAVETAMKFAKKYTRKTEFIAFQGGFHGFSQTALAVSGVSSDKKRGYLPLMAGNVTFVPFPYCYRCMFGMNYPECNLQCFRYIENLFEDSASGLAEVAAMVLEPIQAAGGVVVPPKEYLPNLRRLCDEKQVLMIVDEIQAGMGRTGRFFASEHWGVTPDFVPIGKGIAGGLPMGAVIGKGKILDGCGGYESGTFAANPVCCAAAVACLKAIDDDKMMNNAERLGKCALDYAEDLMASHDIIGDIRGRGLLIGIELVKDRKSKTPATKAAQAACRELARRGVLIEIAGHFDNVLKVSPPLVITKEQLELGLEQLGNVLGHLSSL